MFPEFSALAHPGHTLRKQVTSFRVGTLVNFWEDMLLIIHTLDLNLLETTTNQAADTLWWGLLKVGI